MATSQNGYLAGRSKVKTITVPGTDVQLPIRSGDVEVVLTYVAVQFHKTVQPLRKGWCWGYAYRPVRGRTTGLSNHASGTAIDLNAPNFPYKVPTTRCMTAKQINACRKIVKDLQGVVRWGGDYVNAPDDAMHFEINASPAEVKRVANLIRKGILGRTFESTMITRMQKLLEVPVDNEWGPATDAMATMMSRAGKAKAGSPKNTAGDFHMQTVQNIIDTTVDNDWGPKSQAALEAWIRKFQREVLNINPSGKWGPVTEREFRALRNKHFKK